MSLKDWIITVYLISTSHKNSSPGKSSLLGLHPLWLPYISCILKLLTTSCSIGLPLTLPGLVCLLGNALFPWFLWLILFLLLGLSSYLLLWICTWTSVLGHFLPLFPLAVMSIPWWNGHPYAANFPSVIFTFFFVPLHWLVYLLLLWSLSHQSVIIFL